MVSAARAGVRSRRPPGPTRAEPIKNLISARHCKFAYLKDFRPSAMQICSYVKPLYILVAALAHLHQHHREHDGHGASRHPQREALEFAFDGPTLDCRGHARSQEGLSKAQSLQATSGLTSCACSALRKGNKPPRCCPKGQGRLTSFTAALAPQSSTEHGAIPSPNGTPGSSRRTAAVTRAWNIDGASKMTAAESQQEVGYGRGSILPLFSLRDGPGRK
jgi:hypothetical protein